MNMPDSIQPKHDGPKGPPPQQGIPPHVLHEIMDLKEKVGRLEGMMEILMHSKHGNCECCECKEEK
jgi:hypothetical protein